MLYVGKKIVLTNMNQPLNFMQVYENRNKLWNT